MPDAREACPSCGRSCDCGPAADLFGEAWPVDVSRGPSNAALSGFWEVVGRMSQQVFCKVTGLPRKTVLEFEEVGMPALSQADSGRAKFYDFQVSFGWMRRRWTSYGDGGGVDEDGEYMGKNAELRERQKWLAMGARLDVEERLGKVVDARSVETWWGVVLTDLRLRFGMMGDIVASRCTELTPDEVAEQVNSMAEELLGEMAEHYGELSGTAVEDLVSTRGGVGVDGGDKVQSAEHDLDEERLFDRITGWEG